MDYTVTLSLPDCEADNPLDAVREFQHQAEQTDLFVYRVEENSGERRTFLVDTGEAADSVNHIRRINPSA